jgi:dihydroorotase
MQNQPRTFEVEAVVNAHSHLREGEVVGPLIEKNIEGGADVIAFMGNTKNGLTTAAQTLEYLKAAQSLVPAGKKMTLIPIMIANESTPEDEINRAAEAGIFDVKFLPLNRTTNSHYGIRHYARMIPIIQRCSKLDVRVHIHPEHPRMTFPGRDAEYLFQPILDMFINETAAIIISEHGTDGRCVPFWIEASKTGRFFVTLTAHHLIADEDQVFGDVRAVCKPPIKTALDREQLVALVAENHPWVMAGPDDAPHDTAAKFAHEGRCACGSYTAAKLMLYYAHALGHLFSSPPGLQTFVNFTSRNARTLFGLPPASRTFKLVEKKSDIPNFYKIGHWMVEPFMAAGMLDWDFAL